MLTKRFSLQKKTILSSSISSSSSRWSSSLFEKSSVFNLKSSCFSKYITASEKTLGKEGSFKVSMQSTTFLFNSPSLRQNTVSRLFGHNLKQKNETINKLFSPFSFHRSTAQFQSSLMCSKFSVLNLRTFSSDAESFKKIPDDKISQHKSSIAEPFLEVNRTEKGQLPYVGRSWRVNELRIKCFDDLHKLWYVLLKERNLLLTERERYASRVIARKEYHWLTGRLKKVDTSMSRLKYVLLERARLERIVSLPSKLRQVKSRNKKVKKSKEAKTIKDNDATVESSASTQATPQQV